MKNPATGVSSQLVTLSPLKRDGSTVGQRATYTELVDAVRALVDVLVRCDAENMPNDAEQCTDEQWDAALAAGQAVLAKVCAA